METYSSNTLALTGTLIVRGIISASHYHIENVAEMDSTGSTSFGNTNDDSHARTGSLSVIRENGTVVLNADNSTETTTVRALPGLLSAISVFLYKSVLYGAFVWARRALNSQKTTVSVPSCRRLFGPLFTIAKGY